MIEPLISIDEYIYLWCIATLSTKGGLRALVTELRDRVWFSFLAPEAAVCALFYESNFTQMW